MFKILNTGDCHAQFNHSKKENINMNPLNVELKQHGAKFSCQLAEEQLRTEDGSGLKKKTKTTTFGQFVALPPNENIQFQHGFQLRHKQVNSRLKASRLQTVSTFRT